MRLSFHGADRDVTGSCHLIEAGGRKILVDCGMFQGGRRLDDENERRFGFDPASIDTVLLTHAHLDHCGRLPLLVKRGFRGEIITTAATRELAKVVLLDSAHLHEEEARREARHRSHRGDRPVAPLYQVIDALDSFDRFGRVADYGEEISLGDGTSVRFEDAGHILGSATVVIDAVRNGAKHRVAFSGDIGNGDPPLLRPATPPEGADAVVMETTYGNRLHKPLQPSVEELYDAIRRTVARGGNVVIPTFALERAQELLFFLSLGVDEGRLPRSLPVYLDSPMAISATDIYARHRDALDADVARAFAEGRDPFDLPGLHFTRESADSRAINEVRGGAVILAGSGMATGGRVLHHLRHNLWRQESSVIFVGFAARGTLARSIIDGAERVRVFGDEIMVRAEVHTINGFSAHADRDGLLAWHRTASPDRTFLVHGEEEVMEDFAALLTDTTVTMPRLGESIDL